MNREKLSWIKYEIRPVAEVDSSTGEETPINQNDKVVYINDEEFEELIINKLMCKYDRSLKGGKLIEL